MQNIKESAELIEGRMTFIQQFLQKKYGFGILFFTIIIIACVLAVYAYNEGKDGGYKTSKEEIESLKNAYRNAENEIHTLNGRVAYYKKLNEECNKNSSSENLEALVTQKIQEAEILKLIFERKITNDEKINANLNDILRK